MSRWLPEGHSAARARLFVGQQALVLTPGAGVAPVSVPLQDWLAGTASEVDWAQALAALAARSTTSARPAVAVSVSEHWTRFAMLGVPAGLSRLDELRALAATRFERLFGLQAERWKIEADWRVQGGVLACALPAALVAALDASAWRIDSLQPQALCLMARHATELPAQGWVACLGEAGWTLFRLQRTQVVHVRHHAIATLAPAAFVDVIEAERLREGVAADEPVLLLGEWPAWSGAELAGVVVRRPQRARHREGEPA